MSRAHEDKRDATIRRFLLRELAKRDLSGSCHAILLVIMDECYGWVDKESEDPRRRRDRNKFSYSFLARETGLTYKTVCKAMQQLQALGIVREWETPSKKSAGVYGIISDFSKWSAPVRKSDIPTPKLPMENEGREKRFLPQNSLPPNYLTVREIRGRNVVNEPHNHAVFSVSNIDLNIDPTPNPIIFDGGEGGYSEDPRDILPTPPPVISDPLIARSAKLDMGQAMHSAREVYLDVFDQPVKKFEVTDLQNFFRRELPKGLLLAAWLNSITIIEVEREQRVAEGKPVAARAFDRVLEEAIKTVKIAQKKSS